MSLVSAGLGIGFAPELTLDLPSRNFELRKVRGRSIYADAPEGNLGLQATTCARQEASYLVRSATWSLVHWRRHTDVTHRVRMTL